MSVYDWKIGDANVRVIEQGDTIIRLLRLGTDFEPETLRRWQEICTGGTVIDVGCHTGVFSILAAMNGCEVIAFEPMPLHAQRCLDNFELNGVLVDLRNACATDTDGPAIIKFNPRVAGLTSGASLVRPSGGLPHESQDISVDGVTIDSLNLQYCAAIKIDVERGEPQVLRGAAETIKRCNPALLVEVLGPDEGEAVLAAVPGYKVVEVLDVRNWLMMPA